jgi:hypothetical protein
MMAKITAKTMIWDTKKSAYAHDDTHNAFMTLPLYTRTREGEAPQLGRGPKPAGWAFP